MTNESTNDMFTEIESSDYICNNDYYLHICITQSLKALNLGIMKENFKSGMISLISCVNNAKIIAQAKHLVDFKTDKEYINGLKVLKESENYKKLDTPLEQRAEIANYDLGCILRVIDEHKIKKGKVII